MTIRLNLARPVKRAGRLAALVVELITCALVLTAMRSDARHARGIPPVPPAAQPLIDVEMGRLMIQRSGAILAYAHQYRIPVDLASAIYDIATVERVTPSLAFHLVRAESEFKERARSSRGALGYAQVQLETAKDLAPSILEADLLSRDMNLRFGFRFMRQLLRRFSNNVDLALLAYNRGPSRVEEIMQQGGDPENGYPDAVLRRHKVRPSTRSDTTVTRIGIE